MGNRCLSASLFIIDRIIIKVAAIKGMHQGLKGFYIGHIQTADIGVTWPWKTNNCSYLKTIQNIIRTLLAGSQVSDRCTFAFFSFSSC